MAVIIKFPLPDHSYVYSSRPIEDYRPNILCDCVMACKTTFSCPYCRRDDLPSCYLVLGSSPSTCRECWFKASNATEEIKARITTRSKDIDNLFDYDTECQDSFPIPSEYDEDT